jgi:hypothetical protein
MSRERECESKGTANAEIYRARERTAMNYK